MGGLPGRMESRLRATGNANVAGNTDRREAERWLGQTRRRQRRRAAALHCTMPVRFTLTGRRTQIVWGGGGLGRVGVGGGTCNFWPVARERLCDRTWINSMIGQCSATPKDQAPGRQTAFHETRNAWLSVCRPESSPVGHFP